jgi:DNA polymerase I-like protein with 3'-5' exonuclease and polymerase domains
MFLTVHDSIVFDYVKEELEELAKLCLTVFKNLPYYIEQYFGFSVNVKLEGECEIGVNYGSVKEYDPYD